MGVMAVGIKMNKNIYLKIVWLLGMIVFFLLGMVYLTLYLESSLRVFIQQECYKSNQLIFKQSFNTEVSGMTENRLKTLNFYLKIKNGGK